MRSLRKAESLAAISVALAMLSFASPVSGVTLSPGASIHVTSKNAVVTGDVWTTFGHAGNTNAMVTGTATGISAGAVARLYASTFPFKQPAVPVSSLSLVVTSDSAEFSFTVAPTLETDYRVELFASASSPTSEATSRSQTVYVSEYGIASNNETCGSGRCTIHINYTEVIQPTAVATEKAKHQYLYLSLPAAPGGVKPKPTTFHLVPATVSAPTVRGEHVTFKIAITYPEPVQRYWWYWISCTKDTLAKDGVGLPGHHGCGNSTLAPSTVYVG